MQKKFILNKEDEIVGYIYKITNIINNKIYIGKTKYSIDKRLINHFWVSDKKEDTNIRFHNAIRKYGKENFRIEEIEKCYSIAELNDREKYWISKLDSKNPEIGYNMASGGEGGIGGPMFTGHTHSEETKKQMSIDRTGDKNSNYGNRWHHTPDMKYKYDGKHNPMYGKHHSEESNNKNSKSHLGKQAYSNIKLDKVIMLTSEEGEELINSNPDWFKGNIHRKK